MRSALIVALSSLATCSAAVGCSSSSTSNPPAGDADGGSTDAGIPKDFIADWSCLGKITLTTPPAAETPFDFNLVEPYKANPIVGAVVKVCAAADFACATPLETLTSNGEGAVAFLKVPTTGKGFDGYMEVRVGTETPNLNYWGVPIWTKYVVGSGRIYWGDAQLATLFSTSTVKVDRALGIVGVQAADCSSSPNGTPCNDSATCRAYSPGGVVFDIEPKDPRIVPGYIRVKDAAASLSITDVATSANVGLGGWVNVPPGQVTVTAKVGATGQLIGSYKITVRGGAMSNVLARPIP